MAVKHHERTPCVIKLNWTTAPHFECLSSLRPDAAELSARLNRLRCALRHAASSRSTVVAAGHSIGAALLIAMAGGQMWTRAGEQIAGDSKPSTNRLVLFTPAMDFFRAPGALDAVRVPIQAWSGTADTLTPPSQAELLKHAAGAEIDLRVIEGAGHFSFMNLPPPHISDPMPDREAFLHRLAQDAGQFLLGE